VADSQEIAIVLGDHGAAAATDDRVGGGAGVLHDEADPVAVQDGVGLAHLAAAEGPDLRPTVVLLGEAPIPRTDNGGVQRRELEPLFAPYADRRGLVQIAGVRALGGRIQMASSNRVFFRATEWSDRLFTGETLPRSTDHAAKRTER
jgi:hypothetical protein